MQAGFCSWYSTGGAIDGLLLQLPITELNKTGDFESGQSGVMFEKVRLTRLLHRMADNSSTRLRSTRRAVAANTPFKSVSDGRTVSSSGSLASTANTCRNLRARSSRLSRSAD